MGGGGSSRRAAIIKAQHMQEVVEGWGRLCMARFVTGKLVTSFCVNMPIATSLLFKL